MTELDATQYLPPEFDHTPQTVVSLVPSMTESLFDLNLGGRLLARTDYCIYPEDKVQAVPTLGGTKNPDIQRIIALAPDIVISNQEENRKEDVEALRAAGITVWLTFPRTVADVFKILWDTMYLFDETSMSARVRLIEYTYDWVSNISAAKEADDPTTVFVPIWHDPLMTINANTYMHDLLRVVGGTNVFAERERRYPLKADIGEADAYAADDPRAAGRDTRYPRVTWDEVQAAQPDVILLPSEPFHYSSEHLPAFEQLDVPAAHNKRVHLVDGSYLSWHGTRLAYALDALPKLFQEQADTSDTNAQTDTDAKT